MIAQSESADKVGGHALFALGQAVALLAKLDALDEERHVARQRAHGLQAFQVLRGLGL